MKLYYKINNGFIYRISNYWNIKVINNIMIVYIYNYIIIICLKVEKNKYIGFDRNNDYTFYYYN